MTPAMKKLGFAATALIVLLLAFNSLREDNRQETTRQDYVEQAMAEALPLFANNCVECHDAFGTGLNEAPALNDRDVRNKDADELFRTIERGRDTTAMVAYSLDEGGAFTDAQIDNLVTLIKYGDWRMVEAYVEAEGLTPADVPPLAVDAETLSYPLEMITAGRETYLGNCYSCHRGGTTNVTAHRIGTALDDNDFIRDNTDEELLVFVQEGRAEDAPDNVTGNEMPPRGGNTNLGDEDILNTIAYLRELNTNPTFVDDLSAETEELVTTTTWEDVAYRWVPVVDNLDSPTLITHAGDGSGWLFAVEQPGIIMVVEDGTLHDEDPFMDISHLLPERVYEAAYTEQGLLGLAFHPQYESNGQFFVSYSNTLGNSVIARYHVRPDDPYHADPESGEILLTVEQPFEDHNGGNILFGPDGYLYIGFGDGGNPADPNYNSQDTQQYLGKMLRIDVDSGTPYGIPPDNPFVDNPDFLPEIWAYGLRNPWRYTFDRATGDLYIGDVGQWRIEEVDYQPASSTGGENYGWSAFEGREVYLEDVVLPAEDVTMPILQYEHSIGLSITGGYVYRGEALPALQGYYVYGDYMNGFVWFIWRDEAGDWQNAEFMDSSFVISSFGEDEAGELYLVDYKGIVYRLELDSSSPSDTK